jgi:hypothetical protein
MNKAQNLIHRIGFRGGFLLMLAVGDFGHGVYYTFGQATHAPIGGNTFWGITFFLLGALLLTGVLLRRDRWYFITSGFVMMVWGLNYMWNILNVPYQWGNGVAWLMVPMLTFLVATWPEPYRIRKNWPRPIDN